VREPSRLLIKRLRFITYECERRETETGSESDSVGDVRSRKDLWTRT